MKINLKKNGIKALTVATLLTVGGQPLAFSASEVGSALSEVKSSEVVENEVNSKVTANATSANEIESDVVTETKTTTTKSAKATPVISGADDRFMERGSKNSFFSLEDGVSVNGVSWEKLPDSKKSIEGYYNYQVSGEYTLTYKYQGAKSVTRKLYVMGDTTLFEEDRPTSNAEMLALNNMLANGNVYITKITSGDNFLPPEELANRRFTFPLSDEDLDNNAHRFLIEYKLKSNGATMPYYLTAVDCNITKQWMRKPANYGALCMNKVEPKIKGATNINLVNKTAFNSKNGVTAYDEKGNNITNQMTVSGTVDINKPGTYTLTYKVTDKYNAEGYWLTSTVKRKVTVVKKDTNGIYKDLYKNGKKVERRYYYGNTYNEKNIKERIMYNTSGKRTTRSLYDTSGFKKEYYKYDASGKVKNKYVYFKEGKFKYTRYEYNTNGKVVTVSRYYRSTGKVQYRKELYTNGKVKKLYTYNTNGKHLTSEAWNSKGIRTDYNKYDGNGFRTLNYDYYKNGKIQTKYKYYKTGNTKYVKESYNTKGKITSATAYNRNGNKIYHKTYKSNGKVKSVKNYK